MIWTIWSGISGKEYLRNYLDFKQGKCKERLILDTFLTIEKLFDLAKKYKKNIIS